MNANATGRRRYLKDRLSEGRRFATKSSMRAWSLLTPMYHRIEDLAPGYARMLRIINPMTSIVSAYRDVLYRDAIPAPTSARGPEARRSSCSHSIVGSSGGSRRASGDEH
jgi:hypothetical protein